MAERCRFQKVDDVEFRNSWTIFIWRLYIFLLLQILLNYKGHAKSQSPIFNAILLGTGDGVA